MVEGEEMKLAPETLAEVVELLRQEHERRALIETNLRRHRRKRHPNYDLGRSDGWLDVMVWLDDLGKAAGVLGAYVKGRT